MTVSARSAHPQPSLRSASPALVMLGRAGYVAKGVVYLVIGALAARAALGSGGATTDSRGALSVIGDGPLGTAALLAIGIGLLGFMLWRLVAAATDAEGKGDEPTKLVVRAAQAARGVAYGAMGLQALRLMKQRDGAESSSTQDWTARLLELPFGRMLVGAVGLGIIGYALYQLYRASSRKVLKHLDLAEAGPTQSTWIERLGRFGIAARGVVFGLIGTFVVRAAMQSDSAEAGGMGDSLRALAGASHGRLALGTVALGLVAYGVYELATARYRQMRAVG